MALILNWTTAFFKYFGFVLCAPLLYLFINGSIVFRNLAKGLDMISLSEALWMIGSQILQMVAGAAALYGNFDTDKILKSIENEEVVDHNAILFLIFYVVLIPTLVMAFFTGAKILDDRGKLSKFAIFCFVLAFSGTLLLVQSFFELASTQAGIIANVIWFGTCYIGI